MNTSTLFRSLAVALPAAALAVAAPAQARDRVLSDIPDTGLPKTYAWAPLAGPQTAPEADPRVDNSIIKQRVMAAVDSAMAAKGYVLTPNPANAGMLVAYRLGVKDKTGTDVNNWGYPYPFGAYGCGFAACYYGGFGWGPWGPPDTTVSQYNYTQGRLMVDIMDKQQPAQLLWRSTNDQQVDSNDGRADQLDKLVTKMLKKLPPPNTPD